MSTLPQSPCPRADLATYTTTASNPYILYCNIDFSFLDLPPSDSPTLASCITIPATSIPPTPPLQTAPPVSWFHGEIPRTRARIAPKFQLKSGDMAYVEGLYSTRRVGYQINDALIYGARGVHNRGGKLRSDDGDERRGCFHWVGSSWDRIISFSDPLLVVLIFVAFFNGITRVFYDRREYSIGCLDGAKDGIGVGVGLAAMIFLSVLLALFLRRRRGSDRRRLSTQELPGDLSTGKGMWREMRGHEAPELNGDERSAELEGSGVKMRQMGEIGKQTVFEFGV